MMSSSYILIDFNKQLSSLCTNDEGIVSFKKNKKMA